MKAEAVTGKVKAEAVKGQVKTEKKAPASGLAARVAALKAERKVAIKEEASKPDWGAQLIRRGLELRAKTEAKLKREAKVRVKRELKGRGAKGKKTKGKRVAGKRRASAKMRNARREVMARPLTLSAQLADVLGAPRLSRPATMSRLWAHCKDRGMLNPDNRREIIFDEKLRGIFGEERAGMTDLLRLVTPHFDYSTVGVKDDAKLCKEDRGRAAKLQKREQVQGQASPMKLKSPKREVDLETGPAPSVVAEVIGVRLVSIEPEAVGVEFELPEGCESMSFEAVATPVSSAPIKVGSPVKTDSSAKVKVGPSVKVDSSAKVGPHVKVEGDPQKKLAPVRKPCSVLPSEDPDRGMVHRGVARLEGLDPATNYSVSVDVSAPHARAASRCMPIALPQRATPAAWTPQEVVVWCMALQVPELARRARDYAIDGATLLALTAEDFPALGVAAPFLVRRIMSGLESLRGIAS